MTDFRALEYDSLHTAIRVRATLAPALLVAVMVGWAALTLWVFTTDVVSAATLVPLMVLVTGYETLHALRVNAQRLARYLQVAYEEPIASGSATSLPPTPQSETTSLYLGQRFSSVGSNALFSALFVLATFVNYVPAAVSGTVEELVGIGVAHILFAVRIIMAGRLAARVHNEDLERLRTLLNPTKNAPPH